MPEPNETESAIAYLIRERVESVEVTVHPFAQGEAVSIRIQLGAGWLVEITPTNSEGLYAELSQGARVSP